MISHASVPPPQPSAAMSMSGLAPMSAISSAPLPSPPTFVAEIKSETTKPYLTKAVARNDLPAVRKIVDAAAAISVEEKIKTINFSRRCTEQNQVYYNLEDNSTATTSWFDVSPLATAAMRGHDTIVEYLLQQGADPTLKGIPIDDIDLPNEDDEALIHLPELHMNAFDAASKLCRKIRCCRRTQDLLMVVKPYWKRCVYSGSSAARHKRTIFSNLPTNVTSVLDSLKMVHPLSDYPLVAKSFDESMVDTNYWKKRRRDDDQEELANKRDRLPLPQSNEAIDFVGHGGGGSTRQRRCFSCGELKPDASYNKNQKKKGVEARCISCVATNPDALDSAIVICPACKKPMLSESSDAIKRGICQPCVTRMRVASESKQPLPVVKREVE